jgi:hypothetical protein
LLCSSNTFGIGGYDESCAWPVRDRSDFLWVRCQRNCSELVFACENGHRYPLCPIAVTIDGEVVTASLHTAYGGTHVRLVPMGVGYRYAGHGVWLDGFRENALLNFGKHTQIACSLEH